MIVDTSAIMAIMLDEAERASLINAIEHAERPAISAGCWVELAAVLTRGHSGRLDRMLDAFMRRSAIVIAPVTADQASIARDAYRRYGIGTGHPARLNFGDCFAYALSKATGQPLLFKGDDFSRTDVAIAPY